MSDAGDTLVRDGKAPDALRTIGEVAAALGIRQHVLRYWEEQFPMLKPLKRSGGRRYYRPEDIALVETIDRLVHKEGYTLKGAKGVLSGKGAKVALAATPVTISSEAPAIPLAPQPAEGGVPVEQLVAIRDRLAAALDA
ncbi:MerR family transcriptional regulator [Novosphingobium sp. TH158]|uniref:MerR family transcriptional regulator n=1 Tax=Novosphingobium sp. TH158 TaxID=2067455 RepID=UPI000C7A0733|nr:MerR family transcriptional regulator [Novosphingobium sp. TH158]PLK25619.1 transcriptional regulator [Novosphingobium sp. TH158]